MTKTLSETLNMNPLEEAPIRAEIVPVDHQEAKTVEEAKIEEVYRDVELVIDQGLGAIRNTFSDANNYQPRDKNRARQVGAELIRATIDAIKLKKETASDSIERKTARSPSESSGQHVTVTSNLYVDRNAIMEALEQSNERNDS